MTVIISNGIAMIAVGKKTNDNNNPTTLTCFLLLFSVARTNGMATQKEISHIFSYALTLQLPSASIQSARLFSLRDRA